MLLLSRKLGGEIVFIVPPNSTQSHIIIKITNIQGKSTSIGCLANKNIKIWRSNLLSKQQIKEIKDEITGVNYV